MVRVMASVVVRAMVWVLEIARVRVMVMTQSFALP